MRSLVLNIRKVNNSVAFYILAVINVLSLGVYYYSSMQLEKPAGVSEAIKFLTQSPDKYTIAIVTGIVSIFIVSTLIISAIINTKLILYILDCESNFYFYDEISGKRKILNIAIVVTLFILNVLILKYIVPLLLAMLLVYACIVALCRD